jgi:hypothetical protein
MTAPLSLDQNLALAKFLADHFTAVREQWLNPQAAEDMAVGERHAAKFGGRIAAWVSLPKPAERAVVKDKAVFLAWAKENMPWAIEVTEIVRPGTQAQLLRDAKANGGKWLNTETGEYVVIDGIELSTADPTPRVELTPDATEVIAAAWATIIETLRPMLALPAPGGESDAA